MGTERGCARAGAIAVACRYCPGTGAVSAGAGARKTENWARLTADGRRFLPNAEAHVAEFNYGKRRSEAEAIAETDSYVEPHDCFIWYMGTSGRAGKARLASAAGRNRRRIAAWSSRSTATTAEA